MALKASYEALEEESVSLPRLLAEADAMVSVVKMKILTVKGQIYKSPSLMSSEFPRNIDHISIQITAKDTQHHGGKQRLSQDMIEKIPIRSKKRGAKMVMMALLSSSLSRTAALATRHSVSLRVAATRRSREVVTPLFARPFDRRSFLSSDDLNPHERPTPPTLDSQEEDEGFGAYDYVPDDHDLQHMLMEEQRAYGMLPTTSPVPAEPESSVKNEMPPAASHNSLLEKVDERNLPEKQTVKDAVPPTLFEDIEVSLAAPSPDEQYANREDIDEFLVKASSGTGATTDIDMLELQLQELIKSIYAQNGGNDFNIQSPRQVSQVLFGDPSESTKKEILEGMAAGGNRMADLILQHRALKQQIKRQSRKQLSISKGTRVKSASTVARGEVAESTDPLILVDASAYIFRAYYSMPPIHRSDGLPTGATMGFCNMLNRLVLNRMIQGEQPRLVLVFDAPGKTFRHDLYTAYKANRQAAPMDLIPQFELVRKAAIAYGIPQIEAPNYEADDVIATLARMAQEEGVDTNILSGDKDLMQLVSDEGIEPVVHMIDPSNMERITVKEVIEKWDVGPSRLGDILALAGDAADNVPGIPGIGPKTAALMIHEFGSLDGLLENADRIKQKGRRIKIQENIESAKLSRVLVDLENRVPMESMTFPDGVDQVSDLRMEAVDGDRLLKYYDDMGFRDLKFRVKNRLDGVKRKKPASRYSKKPKIAIPEPDEYLDVPF